MSFSLAENFGCVMARFNAPVELRAIVLSYHLSVHKLTNQSVREAVQTWIEDPAVAVLRYGPIDQWDVSKVTEMSYLFSLQTDFNDNIESWNVANVINMSGMFQGCNQFNQPLHRWQVNQVRDMSRVQCSPRKIHGICYTGYYNGKNVL